MSPTSTEPTNILEPPHPALSEQLLLLKHLLETEPNAQLVETASWHANPHVSWGSFTTAGTVAELTGFCRPYVEDLIQRIKPHLLKVDSSKITAAGYKNIARVRALRPHLGFADDDARTEWKRFHTRLLLMVWMLISLGSDAAWPLVTSFILNVLDDPEPYYKAQGCALLQHLIDTTSKERLKRTGLTEVFLASVKTCLTYLPRSTPVDQSLALLAKAYPVVSALIEEPRDLVALVNEHILSSLSHVSDSSQLGVFLFLQLALVVKQLHNRTFICMSRVNYAVSQTLVNPLENVVVVAAALKVHNQFLKLDPEPLLLYKYDFLAAWSVVKKRHEALGDDVNHLVDQLVSLDESAAEEVKSIGLR